MAWEIPNSLRSPGVSVRNRVYLMILRYVHVSTSSSCHVINDRIHLDEEPEQFGSEICKPLTLWMIGQYLLLTAACWGLIATTCDAAYTLGGHG